MLVSEIIGFFFHQNNFFKGIKKVNCLRYNKCLNAFPKIPLLVPWFEILGMVAIEFDIFFSKNINCYYWIYIRTYVFVDIYNEAQIVNKAFNLSCLLSLTMRLLLIFSTQHPALASPDDHNSPDSPCQHPIYTEHKYQHILHTRHIQKYCIPNNSGQMMP